MAVPQNPIDTLPYELLGEVFTHCAALCPDAPLLLGAVSHHFRAVVHSTPAAWGCLRLSGADGPRKAARWFAMAKACPLDVHIQIQAQSADAEVPHPHLHPHPPHAPIHATATTAVALPPALETLHGYTHRIAALRLCTGTQAQARAALAAIYGDATPDAVALRSLTINVAAPPTPSAAPPPPLPAVPGLLNLETTNVALGALPSLALANLRRLRLVQPLVAPPLSAPDILALLAATPRLERLKLDARIADPAPTPAAPHPHPCVLAQLARLHLRANNLVPLLDAFIAPALRELRLSDLDGRRAGASCATGAALHRLLVRGELGTGAVRANALRVFALRGVAVERGSAVWGRALRRMAALEVFSVEERGEGGLEEEEAREAAAAAAAAVKAHAHHEERPGPRKVHAAFAFSFGAPAPES
ncbi:hypothetical protein B0H15DRAFT_1018710 [Mycena belliarum]|uniref:F-box domain-containing protein n=1 Tax=Mycena belliarum TaxID=1033014 RepID=A0AAD6XS65_9AGAR|nr:hypothetical protein B0H15DRAFT_1018710 [Mycena belliae]